MDKILSVLLAATRKAGEAILTLQKTGFATEKKLNQEIVTEADYLANDILQATLLGEFPDYAWLSEESALDANRLNCKRTWIVDPIDGTKEYASGIPEYAISVALIENNYPILAAVFNPATDELFYAAKNQGAWLGDKKIHCRSSHENQLLLLASRSEYARGEWKKYAAEHEVKQVGSIAYKLGLIAAGFADATFSLGPKNEWDIAAGVLLVEEAGGFISNKQKEAFRFNREDVLVNGIVATSMPASEKIFNLIAN